MTTLVSVGSPETRRAIIIMTTNQDIKNYIEKHKDSFLEDLFSLIRIPSISSQSTHKEDMVRCAERWVDILKEVGLERTEIFPTAGHPVVYAERHYADDAPTVLVYGHYDVMPAEPLEEWKQEDPFEPEIKDGLIVARGADDCKGQSSTQIQGLRTALELGLVKCNVKVLLEGEEEIGSVHMEQFLKEHKDLLACDVILVSDTDMVSNEVPSITTGLRGMCYWEVEVSGPSHDLHSGHYGGAVANPTMELSKIITKLVDEKGKVTIPGFYDDVIDMTVEDHAQVAQIPYDEKVYADSIGVPGVQGEEGYVTFERNSWRPALDVCGIYGGYTGEGAKTIIPAKATAKISTRLVANQDKDKIIAAFEPYIKSLAPDTVRVKVTNLSGTDAYNCPTDLPAYKTAEEAYEAVWGKKPIAYHSGGSIGVVILFERILQTKTILMGFGLGADAIHSPNESFPLTNFYNGIQTVAEFYARFGHE